MTPPNSPDPAVVATLPIDALAELHARLGEQHARAAANTAPWYHDRARDTRRAADHFAVAAALHLRVA